MLRQPEALNCLPLELINGLHEDSDSDIFAFKTQSNFQLENEIDPCKGIFEGIFHQKVLPIFKVFL